MAARLRQNSASKSRKKSDGKLSTRSAGFSSREENIAVRTSKDQATETDKLGFEPYVKAIAKFLTNQDTKPPLVLSIEGEWGSGKTSFMLQLKKELNEHSTIWFDPWRYDKEEELWAVFASHFIESVIQGASLAQRVIGHVKRFVRRYQWREGWFDLTIKTITWVGLFIIVLLMGRNVLLYGNQWVEHIYNWLSDKDTDLYKTFIETGIQLGGVTGFLVLLFYTVGKLMPIIEDPLKADLRKYISSPNYEDRVPFIKRFRDDFKEILDIYIGQKTIFVFIDDLDRCEVPKAADVMSAINLMLGDDNRVVFIIAMDREKVAAGLAVKYEKILPYILASRDYNRSNFSNREFIGLEFGYEFIEKFVQLPFRIPQPDSEKINNLLGEVQLEKVGEEKSLRPSPQVWVRNGFSSLVRVFQTKEGNETGGGQRTEAKDIEAKDIGESDAGERASRNERRESVVIQIGAESANFIAIVKQVAVAFDYNPRRIKQFINLFRLRVYIAAETGLFDDDPNTRETAHPLTLEKIAKLTALELRWPVFMADIQGNADTLTELQQIAYGVPLKTISPQVELWRARQDLMNFLKIGQLSGKDVIEETWNLAAVNLDKWLKVSPRIREVTPFIPRAPGDQVPVPEPVAGKPASYIPVNGKVKYNLAGEFCVAYIAGENINAFLEKWKGTFPEHYARILGGNNDKPTGIDDLSNMLKVYGRQGLEFRAGFMGSDKRMDLSPARFQQMLETHSLIAGVSINQKSFQLARQGIRIWVVLEKIKQNGSDDVKVDIYNPYINGTQMYTYDEFIKSMGLPSGGYGLWIPERTDSVRSK